MYTAKRIKAFLHLDNAHALLTALSVCLCFCGCTDSELVSESPLPTENSAAVISLNVKQQTSDQVRTRAFDDSSISNLYILVYNDNGSLIGYKYLSSYTSGVQLTMDANSGTNCTIYAIANLGSIPVLNAQTANTKANLQAMMCGPISGLDGTITNERLVMSGSITGVTIYGKSIQSTNTFALTIQRLVAKSTFTITPIDGIHITGYSIKNLPKYAYLVARPNPNESSADDIGIGADANISERFDAPFVPTTSITGLTFYMFENRRGGRVSLNGGNTGTLTDQKEKGMYAPNYATYLEVYATGTLGHLNVNARFISATYRIYLGADNSQNYNVKRNGSYNYIVNINSATDIDTRVTKVSSPSNCYIVPPNRAVIFPAKRANAAGTDRVDLDPGWTVDLLWTDNSRGLDPTGNGAVKSVVKQEDGTIKVETGNVEGNAVVAARNSSGVIVWSWHIWVTSYDPNTTNLSFNNKVFMDRNLGAINVNINNPPPNVGSLGLLYQWGRKDPFPASSSYSAAQEPTIYGPNNPMIIKEVAPDTWSHQAQTLPLNNINNTIQNPLKFYFKTSDTGGPNGYDWYTTTGDHNNDLWGGNGSKSVYDPSPEGWRIPKSGLAQLSPWYGLNNTGLTFNYGYNWASVGWYPAVGYRYYKTGDLTDIGVRGAYWSSTVGEVSNNKVATFLFYFITAGVYPDYNFYKSAFEAFPACGFPIRCVKE
jgi:hypothetical protein